MRSLGLSCVLLVAILCSGALSWEATYTSLPSNDAFGSNGLPIAGKRLRAGFYVTPASGNRLLCASRDDDLWAPTYPSGYCVDSDFKIRLKEFWVTAYFTCQSGGTTITPTWKASLFIADPQRDYAEIPIGYKIQSGPSTNPTQNWFTDLNPEWNDQASNCDFGTLQFQKLVPHVSYCSNDKGGRNPLLFYFHIGDTQGQYFFPSQPTGISTTCFFDPTSATQKKFDFCDATLPTPPAVTDYLLYPSYDFFYSNPGFYPDGCNYYGTAALKNVQWSVSRHGAAVAASDTSNLRSFGTLLPNDVITMKWDGYNTGCKCVRVSLSVKKTNFPTFVPSDNQALVEPGWAYAIVTGPGQFSITMPSRDIACNYQVDAVVGPPLAVVGPLGAYYGSSTRISNGKNPGTEMLVGANNGGDGQCFRYFQPSKQWIIQEGVAPTSTPPVTLPSGFTVRVVNSNDGTSASCTYDSNKQLTCTYDNRGLGDGRTDALFVNIGAGSKVTVAESAWVMNEQVSPRPGQAVGAADEFVNCGANGICTVDIVNRLKGACLKGDTLVEASCGCVGDCFSVELRQVAAGAASGTSEFTWGVCNGVGPNPPCGVPVKSFYMCTDTGVNYLRAANTKYFASATGDGSYTAGGCKMTVTEVTSTGTGNPPCTGLLFTPSDTCWASGECIDLPLTVLPTASTTAWQFYHTSGTSVDFHAATVIPDGCCQLTGTCASATTTPSQTTSSQGTTPPQTTSPPTTICDKPGFLPPGCNTCVDLSSLGRKAWCQPDGNTPPSYVWVALPLDQQPIDGSYEPRNAQANGNDFELDCDCSKIVKNCTAQCTGDVCICDYATGQCRTDTVCQVPTQPPGNNPCLGCPIVDGKECSGNGACINCECVCTTINGIQYNGTDCSSKVNQPPSCYDLQDCASCLSNELLDCSWCTANGGVCQKSTTCVGGEADTCSGGSYTPPACPNNCTSPSNGQCKTDSATNVTACVCLKGFHGVDCSKQGGRSSKGVAAAISGGVIAAIVLAGVVALAVISFGAKKTYDWVGMRDSNLGAARNNPTFQNPTNETNNYLYVDSAGTSPNSSPRS